ncbi:MAG TPA: hypothetical protein VLH10_01200 [Yinghuangia sp.]|nr:hypothetical protein [Yinghuangia sp.]
MAADDLRFHAPPRAEVRFSGSPGRASETESTRTNLPDPVPEGVDFHDIRVVYTLANRLVVSAGPPPRPPDR